MQILINRDGQQHGPYTVEQAQTYLATGQVQPADNAWAQGQPAWQPLAALLAQLAGRSVRLGLEPRLLPATAAAAHFIDPAVPHTPTNVHPRS